MKISIALGAICATVASATAIGSALPPPSATTFGITYRGPVRPGGEEYILHGTAQEIHKQILELNPDFNPEDFEMTSSKTVAKRSPGEIKCYEVQGDNVDKHHVMEPIDTLKRMPGWCTAPMGPGGRGGCHVVSCAWGAGVELCNDRNDSIEVQCSQIGDYAGAIFGRCSNKWTKSFRGQMFDSNHWNVVIRYHNC